MTPFTPELMQTLEDLIPAIAVIIGLSVITYIAFLQNALSNARQTMKDQAAMLAADINLQMDDLEKVQNAKKNEDEANRKYNKLLDDFEKSIEELKEANGMNEVLSTNNSQLETIREELLARLESFRIENKSLKDRLVHLENKLARKSQPRDEHGHFSSLPKKNPNIGKYLCNDFVHEFTIGNYYKRYQSKTVDPNSLILIGDDLKRHTVDPDDFQLITE